ncbi:GNAT family N-acetyltransferase [Emcibacter sp. SYSU 3D8]|uniref:GNAT family N-acetyltransferase n=1 Tax=Emcibacter sp. SYSU 3D8 TaxID=3133969 RepID=UPI0031FF0FA5
MIAVRVAGPDDAPAVDGILQDSYPTLMAPAYEPALLAPALALMIKANSRLLASGTFYLAEAGGEPVGCGGWTFDEPGTGIIKEGAAHIRHFGVRADWTGRGVGRRLYGRCEMDAGAAGANRFLCFSSLNGEPFYLALGFKTEERIDVPLGPNLSLPGILMSRSI